MIGDAITVALLAIGVGFFTAGALGVLRFPDLHSRLHALTKADNLGMGFTVAGLALHSGSATMTLKLVLLWIALLAASSTACYLLARSTAPRPPTGEPPR
jgi:multicomponent Na+:H+ antiporter subunit G